MKWPIPVPKWYWQWQLWYLGLGPYKGHRRSQHLRPPAPKRIPQWAWARIRYTLAPKSTVAKMMAKITSYWYWGIEHESSIHYAQERPMEFLKAPSRLKSLPRTADCSEFFTDGYAFAGADDPNGLGYSGQGYTGTLLEHGTPVFSVSSLRPGDAVIRGRDDGDHVYGVLVAGPNPTLMSHGWEGGPRLTSLTAARVDYPDAAFRFRTFLPRN